MGIWNNYSRQGYRAEVDLAITMDIFNEGDKIRVGISKYLNEKWYRWIRGERVESEWRHVVVALAVGSTVMQNLLDGGIFEYAALF